MQIMKQHHPSLMSCMASALMTFLFLCKTTTAFAPGINRIPIRQKHMQQQIQIQSSQSQYTCHGTDTLLVATTGAGTGTATTTSTLYAKKSQQPTAEFELQELRAQFNAMLEQKVRPKMLTKEKRTEIDSYITKVLQTRESPIPLKALGNDNASALHGFWTMVFSTGGDDEIDALGNLPRDCTVQMKIEPNYRADYILSFAKTLGLKSLTAKSSYMVDSSPLNPGLVTFVYQDMKSEVFGFKALPIGLFGMLQGRSTYVDTVWFDGRLWVERAYSPDGMEFYNVYIRSDEED